jgi:predicted RNA-binding protein with PIN domain
VDAANDIELWLVDGFNVLHACVLAGRDRAQWWSSERQRQIVDWIAPFGTNHRVCVVFDAATETSTRCEPSAACVELAYAPSADDAIVERVRAHPMPARIRVVSADRSLGDRCRHLGAQIERPWDFARRIDTE